MEARRVSAVHTVPIIEESVVDFWESIPRDWPHLKYDQALADDLDKLLKAYAREDGNPIVRLLDCGCGTGNPSIGLKKLGYDLFCVDADPGMVARFKQNCAEAGVSMPVITYDWRDMNGDLEKEGLFDAAICRGNSLIYAGCWERSSLIPTAAAKAVRTSLQHISATLRPGGLFYVDVTSRAEYGDMTRKLEYIGVRNTPEHDIVIYWTNEYDIPNKTRRVHARRLFESVEGNELARVHTHTFTGYMLMHDELKTLAEAAGLELVQEYVPVKSELFYDIFIFRKPDKA